MHDGNASWGCQSACSVYMTKNKSHHYKTASQNLKVLVSDSRCKGCGVPPIRSQVADQEQWATFLIGKLETELQVPSVL